MSDEFSVRRTAPDDLPIISRSLVGDDTFIIQKRFGAAFNLSTVLETSFLCVTALEGDDEVVGFAAFSDAPDNVSMPAGTHWELVLDDALSPSIAAKGRLRACNTLFLTFFTTAFGNGSSEIAAGREQRMLRQILSTVFATCPQITRVAFALPIETPSFSPVKDVFFPLPTLPNKAFTGSLCTIQKDDISPPIILRPGIVEDYDDFIPLLLDGTGVVTPLPEALYLDELLQDPNPFTAVVVAEDPLTHQVIGLMCLDASYEHQQAAVKQYATEPFGKIKPLAQPQSSQYRLDPISCEADCISDTDPVGSDGVVIKTRHAHVDAPFIPKKDGKRSLLNQGEHANHNSFQITFFYLNPKYDYCAAQFLPYTFGLFRFAEYCYINLPHAAPEHPLLHQFAYTPIKKFQPTNANGDAVPQPQGLWLCCRYALEDVSSAPYTRADEEGTSKLLKVQTELQQTTVESILVALSQVGPPTDKESLTAILLQWRRQPVGVVITRSVTVEELHALRRNFDLDEYVNFTPDGARNYDATNISLDVNAAKASFYRDEMPAQVVKYMFFKPIFRGRLRFLLREALRHTGAEVLLHIAQPQADLYSPLLNEMIYTPPRRVVDKVPAHPQAQQQGMGADGADELGGRKRKKGNQDVESLMCLYHSSRKALSDEKTKIHARIVVIGASSTGLAFLYSLLTIPYLHFSNLLLISFDGLPEHPNHRDNLWFVDNMEWLEREYLLLKLQGRIRVLEGQMTDFSKAEKIIYTAVGVCEPYDQLMITTGRQYTIPKELAAHGTKDGVFALSGSTTMASIQQHIHQGEIYEDDISNAVIYGSSLDVYAVAATIIRLGLAPQRVVIVSPADDPLSESTGPFMDALVDLKVDKLLAALGTKIVKGYRLERLDYNEDNSLCQVVVAPAAGKGGADSSNPDAKIAEFAASMFIYAHDKDIDANVLSALNKRSIVFDGRVIVENNYRTTDPNIFAAGPVAMFSLRFGSGRDFEEFSIVEVGRHLATTLLGFLGVDEFYDPILHQEEDKSMAPKDDPLAAELGTRAHETVETTQRQRPKPLPKYSEVVTRRVVLPGGHFYFIAHSVNFPSFIDSCQHLTSSNKNGDNYIRISVGPNRYIEAVTFLGNEPVGLYNLRALVGLPESVLNLVYNYTEYGTYHKGQQMDLLEYLQAPWAHVIFYDKFQKLFASIKEKLAAHPDVEGVKGDVLESILPVGADTLSDQERLSYHNRLAHDHSDARRLAELELIKFLHDNKVYLPQEYYLPDVAAHVPPAF